MEVEIKIDELVVPKWFDKWYKTFNGDKVSALYHLNRTGWGYDLTYYNDCEVEDYNGKLNRVLGEGNHEKAQEYLSKAILLGYKVEQEPLYYAKIKGADTLPYRFDTYFSTYTVDDELKLNNYLLNTLDSDKTPHKLSDWDQVGINDTNAQFEEEK